MPKKKSITGKGRPVAFGFISAWWNIPGCTNSQTMKPSWELAPGSTEMSVAQLCDVFFYTRSKCKKLQYTRCDELISVSIKPKEISKTCEKCEKL